ncbi:arylamine N-acetyltransferase family protein [Nocardia barduliensis]|uniref:arylamine N-acetyltransferase family protein n=1 Tax=Nocardia barduliensis TaxID=2736643 RepID=UPI0015735B52|nr:arylamine N-acetyltransferase [Nocardia barduliensis]
MNDDQLSAYLRRIDSDTSSLDNWFRSHLYSIPFVSVPCQPTASSTDVLDSIAYRQGAGDCFYHAIALAAALSHSGFTLTRVLGRPTPPGYEDHILPETHALLIVDNKYVVDTGFGIDGPRAPVPLDGTAVHNTASGQTWWITCESTTHSMMYERDGLRRPLYTFTTREVTPADYSAMGFYSSTSPDSPLSRSLIVQQPTPTGGIRIIDTRVEHWTHGTREVSMLDESDEARALLSRLGIASCGSAAPSTDNVSKVPATRGE